MTVLIRWKSWWHSLQARERRLLQIGTGVCCAALLYGGLDTLSALRERAELARDKEQRVLWRMQQRSEELLRLRAQPPMVRLNAEPLRNATANLLQRHALPATLLQAPAGDGSLQLSGQVPFERWIGWLAGAQTELGLAVRQAQIETGESPGLVKLRVELALRDSAP